MTLRIPVRTKMLVWALSRAGKTTEELAHRFPKIYEWESGEVQPTLKQLEAFASAVHVPFGYLLLPDPPDEPFPLPDFRTLNGAPLKAPSPDLMDTVRACLERQAWYRDFMRENGQDALGFVASATTADSPATIAQRIADFLDFQVEDRAGLTDADAAMREFVRKAEDAGVLIMVSGIVGSNTHRTLMTDEFRGFAIVDPLAPLIFVNSADTKSARLFTLAHELAHIWLGASALSNTGAAPVANARAEEVWCNRVAAELLVPLNALRADLREFESLDETISRLRRKYKVSALVLLRRLLDAGNLSRPEFDRAWNGEMARLIGIDAKQTSSGGDFYNTTAGRVGRRFATAVYVSALEGQTLFRDAYRMLGISKTATFNEFGRVIGVTI
jgi:Zn-dependent peptidase ImmA (M78 family)